MNSLRAITFLFLLCVSTLAIKQYPPQFPIIGVYTQKYASNVSTSETYVSASYVKFILSSGAQVVPIYSYTSTESVLQTLKKVNGVLFPGGQMAFAEDDQWIKNAEAILEYAMKQNDQGNTFPLFGTCQGLQLLAYLTSGFNHSVIENLIGNYRVTRPIFFTEEESELYKEYTPALRDKVSTGNGAFYFNHHQGLTLDKFKKNEKLNDFWKVTAWAETQGDQKIVATIQAKNYPFYAVMFHPEKNPFEWNVEADRSREAIKAGQILSGIFVEQARHSKNKFKSPRSFFDVSIQKYPKIYQKESGRATQIYLFNEFLTMNDK